MSKTDKNRNRKAEEALDAFLETPLEAIADDGFTDQTLRRVRIHKLLRKGLSLASLLVWLIPFVIVFQMFAGMDMAFPSFTFPMPDSAGLGIEAIAIGIGFLAFAGLILIEP